MHLIYLGVTRKLLNLWMNGANKNRIGKVSNDEISKSLIQMSHHIPVEINRKQRSLDDLDR